MERTPSSLLSGSGGSPNHSYGIRLQGQPKIRLPTSQGPGSYWGSWGAWDRLAIEREFARHAIADPLDGLPHQNLKKAFAKARRIKQVGMAKALQIVGLTLEGDHHRALADALNIARLLSACPHPNPTMEG